MKKHVFITILNLAVPVFLGSFAVQAMALETMPNLDISFQIENSVKNFKRQGTSLYAQAGVALSAAEDMQERIDTMLQVRHTAERTVSQQEYLTFVCHAVQTSARATMYEIISILDTIATSITYWQQQQGHQLSYLFHKNPAKLVMGKAQSAEIRQHLDALYALQKTYFSHLGTIVQQVQAVSTVCAESQEQKTLVNRITHAMSSVVGVSHITESVVNADILIDDTVKALYQVPLYVKRANRELKPHTIPMWVTRNWLSLSVAGAGGGLFIYYYLQAKQNAYRWIDAQQAKVKPELYKAAAASLKLANEVEDTLKAGNKLLSDVGVKTMVKLNNLIDKNGVIDKADQYVIDTMNALELMVEQEGAATKVGLFFWQVPGGALLTSQLAAVYNLLGNKFAKDQNGNAINMVEFLGIRVKGWRNYVVDFTKKAVQLLQTNAPEYAQKAENKIISVRNGVQEFNKKILEYVPKIGDSIDTTSRISKNLVTYGLPITALATTYCGYKITKSVCQALYPLLFPTPNYQYVQQSLRDIGRLFNSNQHVSSLSVDSLGALVYHVHTLQRADVPGELKDQFSSDVTELASENYTLEQKLRTIDRMYRSYDFLAVGC